MKNRFFLTRALALAGALLFLVAGSARAQTQTNVTATITDPLGIPYANGTYSIQLIPSGTNPSVNGRAINGAFNGSTDASGRMNVSLWPNASISPAGTKWQFTICISPGVVPPLGTGPQCSTPPLVVTISGTSQNISSALSAVAPRLTSITNGSISSVAGTSPIVVTTVAGVATVSCPTCGTGTISGTIANTQVAFGTAANTIGGLTGFTFVSGTDVLAIPSSSTAAYSIGSSPVLTETAGGNTNIAVGVAALASMTSGANNVGVGVLAGFSITTGTQNTVVGATAMQSFETTATEDTAIGWNTLHSGAGNFNTAVGSQSLQIESGANNTAIGQKSGQQVSSGGNNTLAGQNAGGDLTSGAGNTMVGFQAGFGSVAGTTGSTNVIIGEETNTTAAITTGSSNILLGNSLAAFAAGTAGLSRTASNQLDIGDVILGTALNTPNSSIITFPGTVHSGTDNVSAGVFQSANGGAAAHTIWGSQATTSNEVDGPTTAIVTGDLVSMTTVGTVQKLTDVGLLGVNTPNISKCDTSTVCSSVLLNLPHIFFGTATLNGGTPSTVTVTGLSPSFGGAGSYVCTLAAQSNATTALFSVANVSGSSFTITGPTASTTAVNYICAGN